MDLTVQSLIEVIKRKVPVLVCRSAATSVDYLEVILAHQELQACCEVLTEALGPPTKEFGKVVRFAPPIQKAVDRLGGIRLDQCLFLKAAAPQQMIYASLWPWASDATRVTLKIGLLQA
jgi:hypothetical protein